ncbi:MAG: hypothetical protein HFG80_07395 [Eubacterium sp.]|nr:hypothetical protein [Eubacterium sp.]
MAGYRRFVIYLYWCQKEKVQNVGFAKIELQNNQCRIEIHLKGLPQEDNVLPIYMFSREEQTESENILWGIEIGKTEVKRGIVKFIQIFSAEKIGGSPFDYQNINGILIPLDDNDMIAGQWDNKDIIRQQFRVWQPEAVTEPKTGAEPEAVIASKAVTEPEAVTEPKTGAEPEAGESPTSGKPVVGSETVIESKAVTEPEPMAELEAVIESKAIAEPETGGASTSGEPVAEPDIQTEEKNSEKIPQDRENVLHMQQLAYDMTGKEQKPSKKSAPTWEIASDWEQMWQMLSSSRECFAPVEGKDITAVKIDLKDLRLLPEELWNLGNNSFLLHGFFNYRFLLYGRINQENRAACHFIGIPGVFSNQEKVLAAIFGFPEFYLEKQAEFRTGKSGYWCKLLMSSDSNAYR